MASAAEAEIGASFINAQDTVPELSETTKHTPPMEQAHIWGSQTVRRPRG